MSSIISQSANQWFVRITNKISQRQTFEKQILSKINSTNVQSVTMREEAKDPLKLSEPQTESRKPSLVEKLTVI
jgi:hypothetical protein